MLDDSVHGGEAQTGTGASSLGGEERLEQPGFDLIGHADTVVADRELDVFARHQGRVTLGVLGVNGGVAALDEQATAVGHGVARVGREVEQYLL